jgi:dGTPase
MRQSWVETSDQSRVIDDVAIAHKSGSVIKIEPALNTREIRDLNQKVLSKDATRSFGAGNRKIPVEPDYFRTCFEVDRDRILHSKAFRRLAGKTQVFVFPNDHQRTRLTHALEVAQVAKAISSALGLNTDLTEAGALAHDCGHGPGGHYSEEAFSCYIPGGFDHATWGAEVSLKSLNLCRETLDIVANHSFCRPSPLSPEGIVVSWADRFAYVAHDFEDAVLAGIVTPDDLPHSVKKLLGIKRSEQLNNLIDAMIRTVTTTGIMGLKIKYAQALADFRKFNIQRIYHRPESVKHGEKVKHLLSTLIDYLIEHPQLINLDPKSFSDKELIFQVVTHVNKMTDRYAFNLALQYALIKEKDLPDSVI